jgi:hypothetical protein
MNQDWIAWILGATAIVIAIGGAYAVIRPFFKRINFWIITWEQFMVDWAGTPAREGRDAIPGVMERLNNIDGELKRNGGKSIKDTVNRIEKRLIEGDKKFSNLEQRVFVLEERI